jgi:hypothetical protein
MKKQNRKITLNRDTIRTLSNASLASVGGGAGNMSYKPGCLSTSHHATDCNSGQLSCYPADCTIGTSG